MANILLQFCRETNGFSNSKIAGYLGINESEYLDIEKGNTLLTQPER
jgi:transcriptional regulator with XRE-family HTH domain